MGPGTGGVTHAAAAAPLENRLTVHTIRDARGRVLGLGPSSDDDDGAAAGAGDGWEPVAEVWTPHDGAVTGIDVASGVGNLGGVTGMVTSGGDG